MLKMTENSFHHLPHSHSDLCSDPFSSLPMVTSVDDDVDQKGFMELLGFQDYFPHSIFDNTTSYHDYHQQQLIINEDDDINGDVDDDKLKDEIITTVDEETISSVVLNGQQPSSPSSICTSPAHQPLQNHPLQQGMKEKKAMGVDDQAKAKKKKKEKAPRFAFMTRTEIDHLDDGYRWRKYGQKAVKNSHFPRSYYRCTNASCNVKKRVERCMSDASYVITTYEGQHTHPVSHNSPPLISSFNNLITTGAFSTTTAIAQPPPAMLKLDQGGFLQDMLHTHH